MYNCTAMSTLESSNIGGAAAKDYQVETGFLTTLPLSADMCVGRGKDLQSPHLGLLAPCDIEVNATKIIFYAVLKLSGQHAKI